MKAWLVDRLGEPRDVMRLADVADPTPGPGEIVVAVRAAAANFPDVLMCRGQYQAKPDLPFTPGVELCGDVIEIGTHVDGIRIGDRVLGGSSLPRGGIHGGFGELAVMRAAETFPAPSELTASEATSLYIGYQTGWFGLHRRARIQPGETLLVHAGAGGVGSAAIQLGKAAGARVLGVVGSAEKADVARRMGADLVINRREQDFVDVVKAATDGRGADVIYDPVGGDTYGRSTKCIAFEGRILVVGFAGGQIQTAALNHSLVKNYSILGLHWGLYHTYDPTAVRECHAELSRLVTRGLVRPLVSERLRLDRMAEALQRLADGRTVGRVVYDAEVAS